MSEQRFDFGVDIPTKITEYTKRFTDLEGFLDEGYDGEHHMLWDNQEECWIHLDDVLCLMEKEYVNIKEENEQLKFKNEILKSNYQREIQSSIDFCNAYSKTNGELLEEIEKLEKENEQLRQKIKHCVYVDVDNENGCMNCKYDEGSICSILNCGTHDYLEGVSECGLKYWECKEDE